MDNMEERKENKKTRRGATEMKAMGCRLVVVLEDCWGCSGFGVCACVMGERVGVIVSITAYYHPPEP